MINNDCTDFAVFRYENQVIVMTKPQFEQAIRDARLCGCHTCLSCRAKAHWDDAAAARSTHHSGDVDAKPV